jgi:hypothetical protein
VVPSHVQNGHVYKPLLGSFALLSPHHFTRFVFYQNGARRNSWLCAFQKPAQTMAWRRSASSSFFFQQSSRFSVMCSPKSPSGVTMSVLSPPLLQRLEKGKPSMHGSPENLVMAIHVDFSAFSSENENRGRYCTWSLALLFLLLS